jgi:hypothetical protein
MRIKISDWGTLASSFTYLEDGDIGIRYINLSKNLYKVLDKELFFLSVIKYGIAFEEINY